MPVFGGDIIYAADLNDVEDRLPKFYRKDTATARTSTTTLEDDPVLSGIALGIGTYEVQLRGFFTVASTTPKLKTRWGFTGTWNNPNRLVLGPGAAQVAAPNVATELNVQGSQASGQDAIYSAPVTVVWSDFLEIATNVVVTVAGNLSLQWAQTVSNASAVTVQPDSNFKISRVA